MAILNDHNAALQDAVRRLQSGDAAGAIRVCAPLLKVIPKHPAVHGILAQAYRDTGNTEQALARFRSAAELAPGEPARWTAFVAELLRAGQKGRARKVAQKAPIKGNDKKQLLALARDGLPTGPATGGVAEADVKALQAMMTGGRAAEAKDKAAALLSAHPQSAVLANILGAACLATGDFKTAELNFKRTLDISPDYIPAAANLGLALIRQGEYTAAIGILETAASIEPGSVVAQKNLLIAHFEREDFETAAIRADVVLELAKTDVDALAIRATSERKLGRFEAALDTIDGLEEVTGQNPTTLQMRFETLADAGQDDEAIALGTAHLDVPAVASGYARLVAQMGDLDRARSVLADVISADPDDGIAYYRYGLYAPWAENDPVLPKLDAAAARMADDAPEADAMFYALAKARFELGRHDNGFQALCRANAAQSRGVVFDFDELEQRREDIQSRWSKEAVDLLGDVGDDSVSPIFVIGTPRSGSTLVEHVIAAHGQVTSLGEDTFTTPFFPLGLASDPEVVAFAAQSGAAEVRRLVGADGVLLDKYLHNYWRLGALAVAFPKARFVQMKRDPRAVAFSIFANNMEARGAHSYSTDLENIGRFYVNYRAFMDHWASLFGDRIIVADYEQIVEDPEPAIRALIADLGLVWDDACLQPEAVQKRVKTLSVAQVRSGINANSVESWRRHEANLQPFVDVLKDAGLL